MKYIELTIHTTTQASEIISDIMWNYTDFGVTICDKSDIIALQNAKDSTYWDYMDDELTENKPSDVLVKCYIAEDIATQTIAQILADIQTAKDLSGGALPFGTLEDTKRNVDGDDWIDVWKKHFRPIPLGKITVVPEWIEYTPKAGEYTVLLDSNMAFGTGEHLILYFGYGFKDFLGFDTILPVLLLNALSVLIGQFLSCGLLGAPLYFSLSTIEKRTGIFSKDRSRRE